MSEVTSESISQSIRVSRYIFIAALAVFFSLVFVELAPLGYLLTAIPAGVVLGALQISSLKYQRPWLSGGSIFTAIMMMTFNRRWSGSDSELALFQWICLMMAVSYSLPAISPKMVRRICKIDRSQ